MKAARNLLTALVLLLGLSMFTFFAGRDEQVANPSADNVFPSGLGALTELLRHEGFTVVVERSRAPRFHEKDLVVASYLETSGRPQEGVEEATEAIRDHVTRGGHLLRLHFAADFAVASRQAKEADVKFRDGRTANVVLGSVPSVSHELKGGGDMIVTATTVNQSLLTHQRVGQGIAATLSDGILATNRFLDEADNAQFILGVLKGLARPQGRIVFMEATLGRSAAPGLLEDLGPWAKVAWWQGVLLFGVCVYTLGKRFGATEREFADQRSGRQLVDALALVLKKGRHERHSAQVLADEALDRMRAKLRLVGASKDQVLLVAPREFAEAYEELSVPTTTNTDTARILASLAAMNTALAETTGPIRSQS